MILPHDILQAWKNLQVLPPTNHSGDARFFRWVKLKPSVVTVNYISRTTKRFLLRLQPYVLWWPVPGEGGLGIPGTMSGGSTPSGIPSTSTTSSGVPSPPPPGKDLGRPVMHIPQKGHGTRHAHHSLNGMTDTCENITFPQIRWRVVINQRNQNCNRNYAAGPIYLCIFSGWSAVTDLTITQSIELAPRMLLSTPNTAE